MDSIFFLINRLIVKTAQFICIKKSGRGPDEHDKNVPDLNNKAFSLKTPDYTFWLSSKNKDTWNNKY